MDNEDRKFFERKVYESITDEMLTTPVSKLDGGEVALLELAFRGPYGAKLIERLDELTSQL